MSGCKNESQKNKYSFSGDINISLQWGVKKEVSGDGEGCLVGNAPVTLGSSSSPPPDSVSPAPSSTFMELRASLFQREAWAGPGVLGQLEDRGWQGWVGGDDPGRACQVKSVHPAFLGIPSSTSICFIIWGSERFHLNDQLLSLQWEALHWHQPFLGEEERATVFNCAVSSEQN